MSSSNPTTDRDQKLKELKKSLAWICSAELFTVPLQSIDALKFDLEDDEELRQQKRNGKLRNFVFLEVLYLYRLFI